MQEQQLVDLDLLVSKVEKIREAEPYMQFIARFHTDLHNLKRPIIQAVRQSVRHLSEQINKHTFADIKEFHIRKPPQPSSDSEDQSEIVTRKKVTAQQEAYRIAFQDYVTQKHQMDRLRLEEEMREEEQMRKLKEVNERIQQLEKDYAPVEWQMRSDKDLRFEDANEMLESYLQLFDQQLQRKKPMGVDGQSSLALDEYEMRNRIFEQLSHVEIGEFVGKASLVSFLYEHPLLMLYFNIDSEMLTTELKHFESKDSDVLMRGEFHRFLTMPRASKNLLKQGPQLKPEYVLSCQQLNELKHIYLHLDTYGRNTVSKRQLLAFLERKQRSYQSLLEAQAVRFTSIKRSYNLRRLLLFELEESIVSDPVPWEELVAFLQNYRQNEARPTIDVIEQRKVISGRLKGTHIYVVSKGFLDLIKKAFDRCQRYCQYFVDKDEFFEMLLPDPSYSEYADNLVRLENCNGLSQETVDQTVQRLQREEYQYFDLDQIIETFSFGGRTILPRSTPINLKETLRPHTAEVDSRSSTSSQRQRPPTRKKRQMPKQAIEFASVPNLRDNRITLPHEFKLNTAMLDHKKSIRKRRLGEMLKAKEDLEELQLNFKFRARRVPHYPEPQSRPSSKLHRAKSEEANFMPLRLLANPQFWEPKNPENLKPHCSPPKEEFKIEVKPLPDHCRDRNRLRKIEMQNESRRYAIFEQTKKLYEERPISPALQRLIAPQKSQFDESIESPKIVHIKPTPVPDFKELHRSLDAACKQRPQSVTKPKEFNLSRSRPHLHQTAHFPSPATPTNQTFIKKKEPSTDLKKEVKFAMTEKFKAMVKKRLQREEIEQKRIAFEQEQEIEKERRRKEFCRYMFNSSPQVSTKQILQWQTQQKLAQFRRQQKRLEIQNEQEISDIYRRVLARPFLYEGVNPKPEKQIRRKNRNEMKISNKPRPTKKTELESATQGLNRQKKSEEISYKPTIHSHKRNFYEQESNSEQQASPEKEPQQNKQESHEQHYIIKEPQYGEESGSIHMCDERNYSF